MQVNIGRIDQIVRGVVGTAITGLGIAQLPRGNRGLGAIAIAIGAMIMQSAVTRVSPGYAILGIDTRSSDERLRDSRNDLRVQTERAAEHYVAPDDANGAARLA